MKNTLKTTRIALAIAGLLIATQSCLNENSDFGARKPTSIESKVNSVSSKPKSISEYIIKQKFQRVNYDCGHTVLDMLGYDGHKMFAAEALFTHDIMSVPGAENITVPVDQEETLNYNIPHIWLISPKSSNNLLPQNHFTIRYKDKIYDPKLGTMGVKLYKEKYVEAVLQEFVIPVKQNETDKTEATKPKIDYLLEPEKAPLVIENEDYITFEYKGEDLLAYRGLSKTEARAFTIPLTADTYPREEGEDEFTIIVKHTTRPDEPTHDTIGFIGRRGNNRLLGSEGHHIGTVIKPNYDAGEGALENLLSGEYIILRVDGKKVKSTYNVFTYTFAFFHK